MARVLVVDDNVDFASILTSALEAFGFEVAHARDGREALERQSAAPADVAAIDIFMPEMDGVETMHVLRHRYPSTRIIAMSGGAGTGRVDYLRVASDLGAAICLKKPFDLEAFIVAVKRLADPAAAQSSA